jgi:gliding motility-associated lipoprotein GldH
MFSSRTTVQAIFILSFLFLFSSCDQKRFFEENKTIQNGLWNHNQKLKFEVNITDTIAPYDLYLNVRNSGDYPYSNLYFFIQTRFPDGRTARDTMECRLADDYGKWMGSGIGSVKFNRFLFQKGIHFRNPGKYIFEVDQAMREDNLKGIRDIGIRIEKVKSF